MAWEWAGPASGAVVGIAGLVAGWRVSAGGRKHDERMAKARFRHEQKSAHAQWLRERRADAYIQLLEMAESAGQWAAFVQPMMYSEGDPRPELPGLPEQGRIAAQVNAFGTATVKERLAAWQAVIKELTHADYAVRLAERSIERHGRTSIDDEGERRRIDLELRPAERQRREELAQAIAEELNQV